MATVSAGKHSIIAYSLQGSSYTDISILIQQQAGETLMLWMRCCACASDKPDGIQPLSSRDVNFKLQVRYKMMPLRMCSKAKHHTRSPQAHVIGFSGRVIELHGALVHTSHCVSQSQLDIPL